jgi:hypothetical protein
MLTAALVGCQSLPVFPCWLNRSTQHRRQISLLGFQIAGSHVVDRLAGEPTCKLASHYRELGDDMRKVIATKTPPTPEKNVDGDVLPGAPRFSLGDLSVRSRPCPGSAAKAYRSEPVP